MLGFQYSTNHGVYIFVNDKELELFFTFWKIESYYQIGKYK